MREKNIVQEIGEKDTKMIITPYKEQKDRYLDLCMKLWME